MQIDQFEEQFVARHDFEYQDLNFLSNKYKYINFNDIPEAWVCRIDDVLSMMKNPLCLRSVSQVMGFFIVTYNGQEKIVDYDCNLLKDLENSLIILDIDLHMQIKEGIVLH